MPLQSIRPTPLNDRLWLSGRKQISLASDSVLQVEVGRVPRQSATV